MSKLVPAYLWIGSPEILVQRVCDFVCQQLCYQHRACHACLGCRQIVERCHPSLCWLEPDGAYTLEQLEIVKRTVSFARSELEGPYFFVINRVDLLTHAGANSLLKNVEEPPSGYHFILTSVHEHAVLPTLRSRCVINHVWGRENHENQHPLYALFTNMQRIDAVQFLSLLEPTSDEHETTQLLDDIMHFWIGQQLKNQTTFAAGMIGLCTEFLAKNSVPGSSKMLWRTFMTRHQMLVERLTDLYREAKVNVPRCSM